MTEHFIKKASRGDLASMTKDEKALYWKMRRKEIKKEWAKKNPKMILLQQKRNREKKKKNKLRLKMGLPLDVPEYKEVNQTMRKSEYWVFPVKRREELR